MVPSSVRLRGHDSSEGWPSVGWEGEGACLTVREQFLFPSFDGRLETFPAGICYPHRTLYRSSPARQDWVWRALPGLISGLPGLWTPPCWVPPESPRCILSSRGPLASKPLPVLPSTSQDPRSLDGETDFAKAKPGALQYDFFLPTRTKVSDFPEHRC